MHDRDIEAEVETVQRAAKYGMAVSAVLGLLFLVGGTYVVYLLLAHFGVIMAGLPL